MIQRLSTGYGSADGCRRPCLLMSGFEGAALPLSDLTAALIRGGCRLRSRRRRRCDNYHHSETSEGMIPGWGSGRAAIDDFQNGRWGWGLFNSALAISDVFLIKSLVTGAVRLGARALAGTAARLFGRREWVVVAGQEARVQALIARIETQYARETGRRIIVVAEHGPGGALAEISTRNGQIIIYSGERYGQAARLEELLHYLQLQQRGWLGRELTRAEANLLEREVEQLLREAGLRPRR